MAVCSDFWRLKIFFHLVHRTMCSEIIDGIQLDAFVVTHLCRFNKLCIMILLHEALEAFTIFSFSTCEIMWLQCIFDFKPDLCLH